MRENIKNLVFIAVMAAAFFAGGFAASNKAHKGGNNRPTDTLVVYKTKVVSEPQFKTQELVRWAFFTEERTDTVKERQLVPYAVHDTIYVPIVQRYYEELDGRLRLWISGYRPTLDRFELDERETYITRQKKWGFSVATGPAVILTPFHKCPVDAGWGIMGGISYTF